MTNDLAKALGLSLRRPQKLIGAVEQHLLREFDSGRRSDCIHPSEASHEMWCHRATYYRIIGEPVELAPRELRSEMVFEHGHDSHRKWQRWFRDIGILRGMWECLDCRHVFEATSPQECPNCHQGQYDHLEYREVPLEDEEHLLAGYADGEVLGGLIEIKTVGVGTVRFEAPGLVERYSFSYTDDRGSKRTGTDWVGLWNGIRRPFPTHLKQGMLYLHCIRRTRPDVDTIRFLYDPKYVSGLPKEFEVKFQPDLIEDILYKCSVVKTALEKRRPPKRPLWAAPAATECQNCPFRKVCFEHRQFDRKDSKQKREGQERPVRSRVGGSQGADFLFAQAPDEFDELE